MRNFSRKSTGLDTTDRKIYRIEFVHDGEHYDLCVGQPEYNSGETVIAILDADEEYLICTPTQGGYRGKPIGVAKVKTLTIEDFEGRAAPVAAGKRGTM